MFSCLRLLYWKTVNPTSVSYQNRIALIDSFSKINLECLKLLFDKTPVPLSAICQIFQSFLKFSGYFKTRLYHHIVVKSRSPELRHFRSELAQTQTS